MAALTKSAAAGATAFLQKTWETWSFVEGGSSSERSQRGPLLALVVVLLLVVLVVAALLLLRWWRRRGQDGQAARRPLISGVEAGRRRTFPGKLAASGTFKLEDPDPADNQAIAERRRDFTRILSTNRDIWIFTHASRSPGAVLPVDAPSGSFAATEEGADRSYSHFKTWLEGEMAALPGWLDQGQIPQLVDRLMFFISATPGFDFKMHHEIPAVDLQAKYVIMVSKTGQVRAAWYAFVTDKVTPGATSGPFVVKLVTGDLAQLAGRGGIAPDDCTYTTSATRETDLGRIISEHAELISTGVDTDDWQPYLRA
mmetsp:Transcript_58468/g.148203  ORF Transcript_58468/g.148203 Transcript_58468/m.148203 type:complete len:313 (+) Transcript_58468:438-1376(+)